MSLNECWILFNKYLKEHNDEFPRIRVFAEVTGLKPETVAKIYRKWFDEGKLVRVGNYYDIPNRKTKIREIRTIRKPLIEKIKTEGISSLNAKERKNFTKTLVRILMGFIGFVLITCSVHFTYDFNKLGMDKVWAWLLSFSTVVFTSFAFTVSSYMERKRSRVLITILWFIGITYSVFTAVSGQFNDFRQYSASDNSIIIENQNSIIKEQLKAAKAKEKTLQHWRDEEAQYTAYTDLKVKNPGTWRSIQNGVKELDEVQDAITELQNKLLENNSINNSENQTVYNWLGSLLHMNGAIIQFLVILFPSLFIDLCSSISLSFALGKKKED